MTHMTHSHAVLRHFLKCCLHCFHVLLCCLHDDLEAKAESSPIPFTAQGCQPPPRLSPAESWWSSLSGRVPQGCGTFQGSFRCIPTFSIFVAASLTRDTSLLRHAFAEVSPCVQAAFPRPPQHLTITKLCNSIQLAPTKHHACQMFIKRSLAGMYCLQAVRAYVPSTGKQKRSRN